jgi:hypothetical protein
VTTLSFDIFARDHGSDVFKRLSKNIDASKKELSTFGDSAARSFAKTANSLSNIPTAAAGLAGVGQIVNGLSGTLGLLPAAAASAGAAFATLAVGVQGFAEGFKQLADSTKIQKGTAGVADAAVQSARRIESAQQAVARASRGVKDAEEALTRAQQNAKDAQEGLIRAREDAARQLHDLSRSVANAALDEESAVLAVERAQHNLADARQQGASALDLREAELGVRQAEQALSDTRDRYAELQAEAAKANKVGVEGSDQVVQAQRAVADAALGVQHARQGVADAAGEVANAEKDLAQAHEDAARAAGKAGAALSANTEKFDKLGKNAQDTIRSILGLSGAWTGLQHSVSDALFAGVGDEVKKLGGTYIPVLKSGMTDVAGEFNRGGRSLADFLAQGEQVKTVNSIFGASKAVSGQFADSLKPITSIMLDITAVGSEMLPSLTGGFSSAAQGAADFVRNARETGALREWIERGLDTLHKLGELFGNIGGIISTVFSGLNSGGKNFLDTMISVTGKVEEFLKSFEGQQALKALGQALSAVSSVVTRVMLEAFKQLAPIVVNLAPGFAELARQVGDVLVAALQVAGPLLQAIAKGLSDNIDWLGPLAIGLYAGAKAFGIINAALVLLKIEALSNPWLAIIAATIAVATLIITNWDSIVAFLGKVWEGIKAVAGATWEGIKNVIVDPIVAAARWIGDVVGNIVDFFASLPRRIGEGLGQLGRVIGDIFKGALNIAIEIINWFIRRANDLIYGINLINPFDDIPPIPEIKKLHGGGVVPGHPGEEKLAILKANERVFPADYDWGPPAMSRTGAAGSAGRSGQDVRVTLEIVGNGGLAEAVNYGVRARQIQLHVNGVPVTAA